MKTVHHFHNVQSEVKKKENRVLDVIRTHAFRLALHERRKTPRRHLVIPR